MSTARFLKTSAIALAVVAMAPAAALAQSSIAGQVTDNTGGVLPGVTVEAASPALIEGSRVVVSDGTGQYNIIDLRPGTYSVTFTLPGFGTQVRDELILAADFAMNIDVALSVGTLEESVTVSGESPVVDVQQVQRTEVLTREVQEAIPTGRSMWSYAALIPGVKVHKPDVGGTSGAQQSVMFGRGAETADTTVEIDGLMVNTLIGDGGWQGYFNPMMTAETSYTTSGITAETQLGGIRLNMIPAEGGNQFSGAFFAGGTTSGMQSDNWNQTLGDLGINEVEGVPHVDRIYDLNSSVGGPLLRDKLWFFASARRNVINNRVLNSRTRDDQPGIDDNSLTNALARITYQMDSRNKFSVMFDKTRKRRFHRHDPGDDVDTSADSWTSPHYDTGTAKWTSAVSSRMLVEFGFSLNYEDWDPGYQPGIKQVRPDGFLSCLSTPCFPTVGSTAANLQINDPWYSIVNHDDEWLGLEYEASEVEVNNYPHRLSLAGSTSYVTGAHNFKVGFTNTWGNKRQTISGNGNLYQSYAAVPNAFGRVLDFIGPTHFAAEDNLAAGLPPGLIGTPDNVIVYNSPSINSADLDYNGGVYAQDSWTIDRLTLNYGARVDWAGASVPAIDKPSGRFGPAISYPFIALPSFGPDVSPRLSVAYDLFGNAKTAVKASFGRYPEAVGANYPERYAPALGDTDTRDWFDQHLALDANGEWVPSGTDPYGTNNDDIAQDWEIGAPGDANFGLRETDRPDPNLKRMYNDMITVGIQQEIANGVSLSVDFRRRSYHNTQSGDNELRSFDDFMVRGSTLEFARPAPYVGSFQIFNIDPAVRSLVDELDRTRGDGFSWVYTGLEISGNARLPNGGTVFGGWTVEKTSINDCQDELDRGDNPNNLRFCDMGAFPRPYKHEFKVSGAYPFSLPGVGDLQFAASFQAYPGGRGGLAVGDGGQGDANLRETYRISRSGTLQGLGSNQATYQAPWYTADNCVAPCTLGGVIVPRGANSTINTSTSRTDIVLLPPNSVKFYPYWTQLDVNLAKVFNIGGWRYDARFEVFNALNNGVHLSHSGGGNGRGTTLGGQSASLYERADLVLDARVIRVALTARF